MDRSLVGVTIKGELDLWNSTVLKLFRFEKIYHKSASGCMLDIDHIMKMSIHDKDKV